MCSLRLRQAEHQHARRPIAETLQIGFEDTKHGQGICFAELCARRFSRVNQRAVRCEDSERFIIAEQAAHTLGKRQRRSRRLGPRDQDRGLAVRTNKARAGASQRAAEAQPESRKRSRRGGPADGSVAARRIICAAAGLLLSKRRCTHSRVSAAPNSAAPAAFAHRIREASALHSQAGHGLVAVAASRGSRNRASSDSTNVMRRNSLPKEFLIGPGRCGVHGAKPSAAGLGRITLIAVSTGVAAPFWALPVRG